jgi:hypothetical protein
MTTLAHILIAACLALGATTPSWAHGDAPHPKCKKGYELNDQHKCVKKN